LLQNSEGHDGKNQQWRVSKITHDEWSIQSVATDTYITASSITHLPTIYREPEAASVSIKQ
jgi:hypothetical protein